MLERKRSSWLRRLWPVVIILAAAGGLSLWSTRREAARIARIEEAAGWWCEVAAEGRDVSTEIHAEPAAVRTMIGDAFLEAFARARETGPARWTVRVIPGDRPDAGDGMATHHVIIDIDGAETLGLRLMERNEFILVLGYWRTEVEKTGRIVMQVWLNGEFVDSDRAVVSVFDAGVQHAVGLFETMCVRNGRVFRPDLHVARLVESARTLLLSDRLRPEPLADAVQRTVEHNELSEARVRLTITGGSLGGPPSTAGAPRGPDPTVLVVAQPPTPYPPEFFERGVTAVIAPGRANPLTPMAGHKTLDYWPRIHALQGAATVGAGEALWFSVSNHLASGSVSNVFLVKDGDLLTPIARGEEVAGALSAPVLPGITRQTITEIAAGDAILCDKKMLDIDDLLGADEVFLTNSSWGVLPVVGVEKESIGDGMVGEITRRLRDGWLDAVEEETRG